LQQLPIHAPVDYERASDIRLATNRQPGTV